MAPKIQLRLGDCLLRLTEIEESGNFAVISDPPYGLVFLGSDWDRIPNFEDFFRQWLREVFRILPPGGLLFIFSGTRTYYRLIKVMVELGFTNISLKAWTYGSGFPKNADVSKHIDRVSGVEREIVGIQSTQLGTYLKSKEGPGPGGNKPAVKSRYSGNILGPPVTEDAKKWDGWGTALKPAWEPIVCASKPDDSFD